MLVAYIGVSLVNVIEQYFTLEWSTATLRFISRVG